MKLGSIFVNILGLLAINGQVIDEHGCLLSKGYGWCDELKACINPDITECDVPINTVNCSPVYSECDNEYVCPKVEILDCDNSGKAGYTRYRLSVVLKDNVDNIFAIYGGRGGSDTEPLVEMIIPPAYNVNGPYSSDIGGINPMFYTYNEDLMYDSWLTIGVTDGDRHNLLSTIGIDYSNWDVEHELDISNGALFVMDPLVNVVDGNEYIVGQLTLSDETPINHVELNIQGKFKDNSMGNHWDQKRLRFTLETPNKVPKNCMIWFDGCNSCLIDRHGLITDECSDLTCNVLSNKRCLRFKTVLMGEVISDH